MAEAISGATGALQGSIGGVVNKGSAWLDSIFPPEKRNELVAKISKFATEKPMFAVRPLLVPLLVLTLKPQAHLTFTACSLSSPPKLPSPAFPSVSSPS